MRTNRWFVAAMPFLLGALLTSVEAQGKGKGGGGGRDEKDKQEKPEKQDKQDKKEKQDKQDKKERQDKDGPSQARSGDKDSRATQERAEAKSRANVENEAGGLVLGSKNRGRGRLNRVVTDAEYTPLVRTYAISARPSERFLGRAVGIASLRGISDDDLVLSRVGDRVHVKNRRGDLLLDLDDDHARRMGSWKVVTVDDRDKEGAPSFCRSGAGHPVWGRQWCVEKGFGLGIDDDTRWGRATDIGDIVFRRRPETDLSRDVLAQVLGDVVFNRLAAHAITLGLADPLIGRWIGETTGPRVLLLTSGRRPVAEVVDLDRDDRADLLLVALRPWVN